MSTMRSQEEIRNTVVSLGLPEHPYFMRRTVRAMDLLDTGKVNFVGDDIFRVHSQFDDTIYHVELNHGTPGCTCADHQKNPGVLCKHMIAATVYSKQAIMIAKTTDGLRPVDPEGNKRDYWRRCWLIAQGNRRTLVYEEHSGRLFCNCGANLKDCKHKQLVIKTVTKELKAIAKEKRVVNECGSNEAQALQDQMNGQLDSQQNNGNGAENVPSQQGFDTPSALNPAPQLDLSNPFQQSEQLDIDQIEGRSNGELVHKLSNGEYVISYQGIMTLSQTYGIEFFDGFNSQTTQVIARARLNGSERVSGKLPIPNKETALELAKRNAARQLLPLVEIKAVEKKAQLEAEFDWQKAYDKCVKLVGRRPSVDQEGGKAQLDCIIHDLVKDGKLRQDNPSHYDRTEWLIIHHACKQDASNDNNDLSVCDGGSRSNRAKPQADPSERTPELPNNADDFVSECKEAVDSVDDDRSVEANEQPLQKDNGEKRKLMMDKKLRTWLVETDGTKKAINCREICEQFESKQNPSIVTRLRAGIDDGADISIVELDN